MSNIVANLALLSIFLPLQNGREMWYFNEAFEISPLGPNVTGFEQELAAYLVSEPNN
jgi:hypothetical protein